VTDEEINDALERATRAPHKVEAALLRRVAESITTTLRPVRPLPPTWALTGALLSVCAAVGFAGAARLGFYGFEKLGLLSQALILLTLGILAWVTGEAFVGELIPASRHRLSPRAIPLVVSVALAGVFALLFHDYHTDQFVSAGIVCLSSGLLHAIPAALISYLLLRRGFAVNPVSAGMVGGALAGLAGVTMLELHCSNFQALHVIVWHTAVVPVSGVAGALMVWYLQRRSING
jgi:Negative regulator of sigma F